MSSSALLGGAGAAAAPAGGGDESGRRVPTPPPPPKDDEDAWKLLAAIDRPPARDRAVRRRKWLAMGTPACLSVCSSFLGFGSSASCVRAYAPVR